MEFEFFTNYSILKVSLTDTSVLILDRSVIVVLPVVVPARVAIVKAFLIFSFPIALTLLVASKFC